MGIGSRRRKEQQMTAEPLSRDSVVFLLVDHQTGVFERVVKVPPRDQVEANVVRLARAAAILDLPSSSRPARRMDPTARCCRRSRRPSPPPTPAASTGAGSSTRWPIRPLRRRSPRPAGAS